MKPGNERCFVIVRVDELALGHAELENVITVKGIVWEQSEAEREVARLNRVNAGKGCRYFWQTSRASPKPEA